MRWLDGIIDIMGMSLSKLQQIVKEGRSSVLQSMGLQRVRHNLLIEQQQAHTRYSNIYIVRVNDCT